MHSPIALAIIGTIITLLLYNQCHKISNNILRGIAQLGSVFVAIAIVGSMAPDSKVAMLTGQYFGASIIIVAIISKIFGKSRI